MNSNSSTIVFLKGKKVALRPVEEADLPLFQRWINEEDIRRNLLVFRPISQSGERDWFEKLLKNENAVQFAMDTLDGQLIGSTGLFDINWQHRFAHSGTFIGEEAFRNKGLGTDAKMHLLNYAFNTLNLHKLCSGAFEFNERSLRYSLKCGYQVEGRLRKQYFKDGRYWDMIQLGLLREDWLPLWDAYNI